MREDMITMTRQEMERYQVIQRALKQEITQEDEPGRGGQDRFHHRGTVCGFYTT